MVKIWYTMIAGGASTLIEANTGSNSAKYVRSSRRILRRIVKKKFRRPNEMATLLSGNYTYNYIHGCDLCDYYNGSNEKKNDDLDHLIFLCVTDALPFSMTPAESRQQSYIFLTKIRSEFIETFENDISILCGKDILDSISVDSRSSRDSRDSRSSLNLKTKFDDSIKNSLRLFAARIKDEMFEEQQKEERQRNNQLVTQMNNNNGIYHISDEDNNNGNRNHYNDEYNNRMTTSYQNDTVINVKVDKQVRKDNNNKNNNKGNKNNIDLRSTPPPRGHNLYSGENSGTVGQIQNELVQIGNQFQQSIESLINRDASYEDPENDPRLSLMASTKASMHCRELWRQRCILAFVAISILYLVSAMVCGWSWDTCAN